jgi:hypothetical protein
MVVTRASLAAKIPAASLEISFCADPYFALLAPVLRMAW